MSRFLLRSAFWSVLILSNVWGIIEGVKLSQADCLHPVLCPAAGYLMIIYCHLHRQNCISAAVYMCKIYQTLVNGFGDIFKEK